MGTKNNPGDFDCYENAAPDEPMFVLLARDWDAPRLVEDWALQREALDGRTDKVREARECATAMRRWYDEREERDAIEGTFVTSSSPGCDGLPTCKRHPGARVQHYIEHFDGVEHVYPGGKSAPAEQPTEAG